MKSHFVRDGLLLAKLKTDRYKMSQSLNASEIYKTFFRKSSNINHFETANKFTSNVLEMSTSQDTV